MYITIENIIGEKTINLSYPVNNLDGSKEIALIEMFEDNVVYEITAPLKLSLSAGGGMSATKQIPVKKYTSRELSAFLAGNVSLSPLSENPKVIKSNKLANITALNFQLNELNNTENLLDGRPSNNLMTYHIERYDDVTRVDLAYPRYKKLKNGVFQSLTIKITNQNDEIVTDSLGTSVVLHIL